MRVLGHRAGRLHPFGAGLQMMTSRLPTQIVHDDLVAGFLNVGGHLAAHRAEPNESDDNLIRHSLFPFAFAHCIASAIFSAVMSTGKLVLAHGTTGKIEASTTRKPCTPLTRPWVSTTAIGSSSRPMRHEHEACQTPIVAFRTKASSASSSFITSSKVKPSAIKLSIMKWRSAAGPSIIAAAIEVSTLFLVLTTPILRTRSV